MSAARGNLSLSRPPSHHSDKVTVGLALVGEDSVKVTWSCGDTVVLRAKRLVEVLAQLQVSRPGTMYPVAMLAQHSHEEASMAGEAYVLMATDSRRYAVVEATKVLDDENTAYAKQHGAEGFLTYASTAALLKKLGVAA